MARRMLDRWLHNLSAISAGAQDFWQGLMAKRGPGHRGFGGRSVPERRRFMGLGLGVGFVLMILGLAVLAPQGQAQFAPRESQKTAVQIWHNASFPVESFQAYTSPFGYRRSATGGRNREFHYGLDLAAPQGSFIRNWWGGQVVEVTDNTRCGTSIVVQSGDWEHIYCHMQGKVEKIGGQRYLVDRGGKIQIREGQMVQTGARIGRVGMTGRTTGPHLHWGMKHRGSWVDPGLVLRAMQSARPVS